MNTKTVLVILGIVAAASLVFGFAVPPALAAQSNLSNNFKIGNSVSSAQTAGISANTGGDVAALGNLANINACAGALAATAC